MRVAAGVPEDTPTRPPICVWCRRSPAVTATTEPRDAARSEVAARLSKGLHLCPEKNERSQGEKSACAILTGGAIYVLGIFVVCSQNLIEFDSILRMTCLGGSNKSERTPSKVARSRREMTLTSPWAKAFL